MYSLTRMKRVTDPLDEKVKARIVGFSSGSEHSAAADTSPSLSELFFGFSSGESSPECCCGADSETESPSCRNSDPITPIAVDRTDEFRNALAACAENAVQIYSCAGSSDKQILRRNVMLFLRNCGYNAAICKTKWPSCGGLTAGSYEFIDVLTTDQSPVRYFVDLDFASEFEIARPTIAYERMLQLLPRVFVGKIDDLKQILKSASDAAKRSLKSRGLHLPPWRKHRFMQNKWLGPYRRTTNAVTASFPSKTLSFDAGYGVKCRVGFDAGRLIAPSAARTR
ncbi:hypothetical protein SASPL_122064 [Salvia splendens]|uniref:Uncharacterized protein n=1 Tax=Salvia splendens TaxID=180675 RepID=A0A8X8XNL3_SALSN|nr:uncharacterized protein LOC121743948 [Salvia splendens]KAG6414691.1 hypothetical protein SASPL_122064 [Salvia splendens]